MYFLLAFICAILIMFSLVNIIIGIAEERSIRYMIAISGLVLAITGFLVFYHLNNIQDSKIQTSETAFAATAHDLFLGIKNEATGLSNQSNPVAGTIILKDSSTVLITPNSPSTPKTSGLTTKAFYPISLNTRGQDLKISGSLSADNKSWCFQISGEGHSAVYTQLGHAVDGSYCFQGLAYSANDQLVH